MQKMEHPSDDNLSDTRIIDFGCVPVDTVTEKCIYITNLTKTPMQYRVSLTYIINDIDIRVFAVSVPSKAVEPNKNCEVKVIFKPNVVGQSFTDYYLIDDIRGNTYRLTVTGRCYGPEVSLSKRTLKFRIFKNEDKHRRKVINIINTAPVETTYQWMLPNGQSCFQMITGNCGLIRAFESITCTIVFTGTALGLYTSELVCLVLNQEPLFVNVIASVTLPGNPLVDLKDHTFSKGWWGRSRCSHLMENNLNRLDYIPPATVYDRYLDFGTGCAKNVNKNISQTLSVTNHKEEDGYIQWISDPDNVFIIDPVAATIPPNESRLFTIRFRPKENDQSYGYILCGNYEQKVYIEDVMKLKHRVFRIPCVGNTWTPCTHGKTEWECRSEIVLPPTVPSRTTYSNFMLTNKLETPMHFKFEAPEETNFVILPMCGIVPSRGWQIITVALEPRYASYYVETWDLVINKTTKARICFSGSADTSHVEAMSHGYNPETHAMYEFPPTITGAVNYCTAYLHNISRMEIHMRVLCHVDWLGADNSGTIILPPRQVMKYNWWFFPKTPDVVYDTTVTCSCVCLVDGVAVGEPTEIFIHIFGFSEYPDLRVIPKFNNLHDVAVGKKAACRVKLYNNGSCFFTHKLCYLIDGMGDDWSRDKLEISQAVDSLKPHKPVPVTFTVTPGGAGARQISIKYTVLFRTEYDEIEEIQPVKKTICKIWYDGIYPTLKVKRTISVSCPVILTNHCVWNIINVEDLNRALEECRPHEPLRATLFGPDLCLSCGTVVELILVLGSVYDVPVPWSLRREKICECEMVEVQLGISTFTKKHTCIHRHLVEIWPKSGIVTKEEPALISMKLRYEIQGLTTLCFVLNLPNYRVLYIFINVFSHINTQGVLVPLRRPIEQPEYLAVLDCGRVPINNLEPVIRILWLYNPTNVFTTWRLLRGDNALVDPSIRCLLYFAEVPPLGKLAIPFAFMPSEMIDYDVTFPCSFGYDIVKVHVTGQGGLPNCIETRLDMPRYIERAIRSVYRRENVHLTTEHFTIPIMPTHSLYREIVSIFNDTDHVMRFIWLPERIANIINIVMTPCWGTIPPKTTEWITMTVYTLQEPATFTTTVACEILDLTERRRYQRNEALRRNKIEKCNQEFIITEKGFFHPNINDSPPYVLDLQKPQPSYLALTVSISSQGQRDSYTRMIINKQWEQVPPYDLLSSDSQDYTGSGNEKASTDNNIPVVEIIRVIDGILWDALHSKMFKCYIKYCASEDIPTFPQLVKKLESDTRERLSRRVSSGICDAIVNKAVFHVFNLNPKREVNVLEAEEEE